MQVVVRQVTAEQTHEVRRAVLREGRADSAVEFPGDDDPGAIHLAAFDDSGAVVAVATFFPSPYDGEPAYQLRGMAVVPSLQGTGVGARLLEEGVERVRATGARLVWANGRDSAIGFYERRGWKVVGDGFLYGPADLPHHIVLLPLDPPPPQPNFER